MDVEHHPPAVDIRDLQTRAFEEPQSASVDGRQALTVDGDSDQPQHVSYFVTTQDNGQLFLASGTDETQGGSGALQRLLVEEPDAAQRDGGRGAGDLLVVRQVQEVLAQLLLSEAIGAGVKMLGELTDGGDVALLGPCGQPPELLTVEYLAERGRRVDPQLVDRILSRVPDVSPDPGDELPLRRQPNPHLQSSKARRRSGKKPTKRARLRG